ncbi:hypothetical protein V9T40_013922 [Parthenolecanium corni]|uniref:UV-stimulated scaffold protein A C-terminal domain-containing protein n=1 Tax=Parthenolecanium corni TaxID=536013 RepID=A0AAN9Y1R0_9HEMI
MNTETDPILNESVCTSISEIIHELTHKNHKLLNEEDVKKLTDLTKDSKAYTDRVYCTLVDYLKKPHSELRYNAFFIFNIYFKNYARFRESGIDNLRSILELTTFLNYDTPLPPPKAIANELNKFTLKCIRDWNQKFGPSYKKLEICYQFLRRKKNVDFEKFEMEDRATQLRKQEEERKKKNLAETKLKSLRNEMNELKPEIENLEKSLNSCLQILIPTPEQFFISEGDEEININDHLDFNGSTSEAASLDDSNVELDVNAATYRETGMLKGSFSINIDLPKSEKLIMITETEENAIVIENAREHYKLLSKKYLDVVKNWIKNLTVLTDTSENLREIINLKIKVEKVIKKFENLNFEKQITPNEGDSDCDSDFEDVIPSTPSVDEELIASLKKDDFEKPSTSCNSSERAETIDVYNTQNDRKKKLLAVAPKLPYDIDLYHWEEENLATPMLLPVTAEGRQFWSASAMDDSEGIPVPDGIASLRTRTIEFTGKFEPVKWSCRFPLTNGKLCPRRDRYKCPFHGVVVARDETGKCINPEDTKRDEELKSKINFSEAQDPRLLAEIKSATGVDLQMHNRKKRKKDDGLMSIKEETNTVYNRLEKKLFKKSTVKRVAQVLDSADQRKFRDKFGDQFQYVHGTT